MSFPNLIKTTEKKTAKVSLNDCLACSGCVTTAETILIEQQGIEEFLNSINKRKFTVISLSPQSRVALAHYFDIDELEIQKRLSHFLGILGVRYNIQNSF
jgi:iron only hydrogenase large subunit-like protein